MNMPAEQIRQEPPMVAMNATSTSALVMNADSLNSMMRLAEIMAKGVATMPKHLANSPADCLAVVMQSMQWQMNPYAVAQKTHLVNGTLGYEAQLVNAVVQSSGSIVGAFKYEYRGDGQHVECRVGAILRGETAITWGEWLKSSDVTTKNSPLWKVNPKQQIGYLQVKNWARLYCPGAILGVYTPDELETIQPRDITPIREAAPAADGRPVREQYSQESLDKNMPQYRDLIAKKKKTPAEIIRNIKIKADMTEAQEKQINDLAVADAPVTIDQPAAAQEQPQ